jgi:SAM-dependent methyltransferase
VQSCSFGRDRADGIESQDMSALYDRIGSSYLGTRREDPRLAALIIGALGDARSVVNVGAGTGAYEPTDREVLAIEPSRAMIEQRPRGSAPVIQARAEKLPLRHRSFDAALAVNTVHHWTDLRAGLRELRRIVRKRIVILLRDARAGTPFWLTEDYLPRLGSSRWAATTVATIKDELPPITALPVPLPRDCVDGMFGAYWGRPEAYLDREIRRNISNFSLAAEDDLAEGLARLQADLESGAWDRKYGYLRSLSGLDLGHRLLVAELS